MAMGPHWLREESPGVCQLLARYPLRGALRGQRLVGLVRRPTDRYLGRFSRLNLLRYFAAYGGQVPIHRPSEGPNPSPVHFDLGHSD